MSAAEEQLDLGEEFQEEVQEESPPEEEPKEPGKIEFTPEQQEVFDREIGKKTAKMRERERELEEERRRREELQQKVEQYEAPVRPDIPDAPDPYDDNYEEQQKARDAAIAKAAEYDARQAAIEEQNRQVLQQQQEAAQKQIIETVTTYSERADKLGIKADELQVAGNRVADFGIDNSLAQHILSDELGPAITMHLSSNVQDMEKVAQMSPMQAAIYIETNVKPNLQQKTVEPPPEPVEQVDGKGFAAERGPSGVTYE